MQRYYSLKNLNTFGLNVTASHYVSIESIDDIANATQGEVFAANRRLILGGGSNILFLDDFFDGLVLHIKLQGWEIIEDNPKYVVVKAGAGQDWDSLVNDMVDRKLHGIENLAFIPGKVGAAPIQNIGAYGVEMKDSFHRLHAYDMLTHRVEIFDAERCDFGYRHSIFKQQAKGRYIILWVEFKLEKDADLFLDYGNIKDYLSRNNITEPSLSDVRDAVVAIRKSKLPDPLEVGNAGSFFKNPVVHQLLFHDLKKEFHDIPGYTNGNSTYKIPAGWMIEKSGWKGFRDGDAGVHDKQALVLVNHGKATGRELFTLAMKIQQSVKNKFGILLEPEVNII